jgi:hypothetical protein
MGFFEQMTHTTDFPHYQYYMVEELTKQLFNPTRVLDHSHVFVPVPSNDDTTSQYGELTHGKVCWSLVDIDPPLRTITLYNTNRTVDQYTLNYVNRWINDATRTNYEWNHKIVKATRHPNCGGITRLIAMTCLKIYSVDPLSYSSSDMFPFRLLIQTYKESDNIIEWIQARVKSQQPTTNEKINTIAKTEATTLVNNYGASNTHIQNEDTIIPDTFHPQIQEEVKDAASVISSLSGNSDDISTSSESSGYNSEESTSQIRDARRRLTRGPLPTMETASSDESTASQAPINYPASDKNDKVPTGHKVMTININGFAYDKSQTIAQLISKHRISVCILVDTRLNTQQTKKAAHWLREAINSALNCVGTIVIESPVKGVARRNDMVGGQMIIITSLIGNRTRIHTVEKDRSQLGCVTAI